MSLEEFSVKVQEYCRLTGNSRQALAHRLGFHPSVLSHKLNGTGKRKLSFAEAKAIVKVLAEWHAFKSHHEILELLNTIGCPPFTSEEWSLPAFQQLKSTEITPGASERGKLSKLPVDLVPPPHNLPAQLSSFVGREKDKIQVKRLLLREATSRLLTLTGTGGVGKTRLSIQVAWELLDNFQDGIWLIELAHHTNPDTLLQEVATIVANLKETTEELALHGLLKYLQKKQVLLVFDNCEHLIEPVARLVETLLKSCPNLKILANSREALGIAGEITWQVPPLKVPDLSQVPVFKSMEILGREVPQTFSNLVPDANLLLQYEAIRLFVERATAAQPGFKFNSTNAMTVVQICQRLDGIPLALELAAARVKGLTVEQIERQLSGAFNESFRILSGGNRTASFRHQTLHASIDWSYRLLSEKEQVLFRRMAVFKNSSLLDAIEVICQGEYGRLDGTIEVLDDFEILEILLQLVNKSIVVAEEHFVEYPQIRYYLLETVRQFAQEKLQESGEAEQIMLNFYKYNPNHDDQPGNYLLHA